MLIRRVFPADFIFSCLLVKLTFHEHIKEIAHGSIISQLLVNVDCPKERVRTGVFYIWEANEIDSDMAYNIFIVKGLSH